MHETYDHILTDVKDDQDVAQLLCWIAFANKPPTEKELAEVPCIQFQDVEFSYEPERRISDIMRICSSLVTSTEGKFIIITEI